MVPEGGNASQFLLHTEYCIKEIACDRHLPSRYFFVLI
jgi:hypothetical protein